VVMNRVVVSMARVVLRLKAMMKIFERVEIVSLDRGY
jgi:hypothetical protein